MQYAKLIAAVVGMIVLAVKQLTGIELGSDFTDKLVDLAIMALTAFGVWGVPNKG